MSASISRALPRLPHPLIWLMVAVGLACAAGILLLQRTACGVTQWPPIISPAIANGLVLSGLLGIGNSALITSRQPGNRIGWICGITGVIGLVATLANRYALCGMYGVLPLPGLGWAAWLSYLLTPLIIALVFWQIPFWFPYGEYLSPPWRSFSGIAWVVLFASLAVVGTLPGEMLNNGIGLSYSIENPFGIRLPVDGSLRRIASSLPVTILLVVSVAANASLVLRWRNSRGDERQQIKWFAFFVGIVVSLFLGMEAVHQLVMPDLIRSPVYVLAFYLAWIGYPVIIGISVLKYRLYDIDIVIRRTLSYAALSLLLALVYLASVTVLQLMFAVFSGQQSPAAIVISTLLIAALFSPLRRWLQSAIDRRFYRSKYDAARTLEAFSATVRDEVDLEALLDHLEVVVEETMQPESISVSLIKRTA